MPKYTFQLAALIISLRPSTSVIATPKVSADSEFKFQWDLLNAGQNGGLAG